MKTCGYSSHHHTMHYSMPQGSLAEHRFLPYGLYLTLFPRLLFLHWLVCCNKAGTKEKSNTENKTMPKEVATEVKHCPK